VANERNDAKNSSNSFASLRTHPTWIGCGIHNLWERRFGWIPVCLAKDFVSRDYQIQSLEHFDFSDTDKQNSGLPKGFSGVMHVLSGPHDQAVDLNVSIRSNRGRSARWKGRCGVETVESNILCRGCFVLPPRSPNFQFTDCVQQPETGIILDLVVTETATISLKKGSLVSKNFDSSREAYIDVQRSTVSGTFGLRDVLSIKSRSGSMSVDINPKPQFKNRPRPAVLKVESRSGAVNIQYPGNTADIPDRDYRSTIISRSGSLSGKILHGKRQL